MSSKSLSPEAKERVCALVEKIVTDDFGGNKSAASRKLHVSQSFVSEVIARRRGPGNTLLESLADYTGKSLDELAGRSSGPGRAEHVEYDDRYANRAAVIDLYRVEAHPKAIEALRGYAFHGDDATRKQWTEWLWAEDAKARREEPQAPTSKRRPK